MALIYTNKNMVEQGYLSGAVMDLQEEETVNSFTLEMGLDEYSKLSAGCCVYDENNPQFGGMVRKVHIQTAQNRLVWSGLTFAGILSTRIIEPPTGYAYREIGGTFANKVSKVLEVCNLSNLFFTEVESSGTGTWKVDRYTDALSALRKLAENNNLSMIVTFDASHFDADHPLQKLRISFKTHDETNAGEEYDSDLFSFDIEKDEMPVNHLICLGGGQLQNREVIHLYLNSAGAIVTSRPSDWSVANEVEDVYDYSNVESIEELEKEGKKHFQELLDDGTKLEISPPEELFFSIGDIIAGRERISGIYVEKVVKKIIYKAQDDLPPSIRYETANTKGAKK